MRRICAICLAVCLCFSAIGTVNATENLDTAINQTAAYLLKAVSAPQISSTGGEWAVIGLARSGYQVPQTDWDTYYDTVEAAVQDCGGVLHQRKYTEYSRVTLALTAIGKDPTKVGDYNLRTPLGDFDKTAWQGINGAIWALIALDSGDYAVPVNDQAKTQATRQMYVQHILDKQLEDGGWSLTNKGNSDPDVTGMALQDLSNYIDQADVKTACDKALTYLSQSQNDQGGFDSWNSSSVEAVVQVAVGLCAMDISLDDPRFVKNGNSLLDNLLTYQLPDGGFAHAAGETDANLMATEQAFYGTVAAERQISGTSGLYDMDEKSVAVTVLTWICAQIQMLQKGAWK